jgi:K+-transporting ATPase ATPase A chain
MSASAWAQLVFLIALLAVSTPLLGNYLAQVYGGGKASGDRVFAPIERFIYRICRVDPEREQRWTTYAYALLAFSFVSGAVLYFQLRLQGSLPLNPEGLGAVKPALAFNTAVSFLKNTNWQNYPGESTISYHKQMAGLAIHNIV